MDKVRSTAVQQVTETIALGIEKGTFRLGEKLPPQRQLAEMFGVSRIVVREAIKVLEGQGLLISRQGSGIYVRRSDAALAHSERQDSRHYSMAEIIELCEVIWRYASESLAARQVEQELRSLQAQTCDLYDNFATATEPQKFVYEANFGLSLCRILGNRLVYDLMVVLLKATSEVDYSVANSGDYRNILSIDKRLLEALLERDGASARLWAMERDKEINRLIRQSGAPLEEEHRIVLSHG